MSNHVNCSVYSLRQARLVLCSIELCDKRKSVPQWHVLVGRFRPLTNMSVQIWMSWHSDRMIKNYDFKTVFPSWIEWKNNCFICDVFVTWQPSGDGVFSIFIALLRTLTILLIFSNVGRWLAWRSRQRRKEFFQRISLGRCSQVIVIIFCRLVWSMLAAWWT